MFALRHIYFFNCVITEGILIGWNICVGGDSGTTGTSNWCPGGSLVGLDMSNRVSNGLLDFRKEEVLEEEMERLKKY